MKKSKSNQDIPLFVLGLLVWLAGIGCGVFLAALDYRNIPCECAQEFARSLYRDLWIEWLF